MARASSIATSSRQIFSSPREGHAKLLDFGLAKIAVPGAGANPSAIATALELEALTGRGAAIGTVPYMSPEQVRGEELDARTDLFSFGAVLYEMATGVQPFRGDTSALIAEAILNRAPVAPVRLNPDVPPKLEEIITKALEKDKKLRYQSAADIRTDLQRLKRDSESSASSLLLEATSRPAGRKKRWPLYSAAAIVAVAFVAACSSCTAARRTLLPRRIPSCWPTSPIPPAIPCSTTP